MLFLCVNLYFGNYSKGNPSGPRHREKYIKTNKINCFCLMEMVILRFLVSEKNWTQNSLICDNTQRNMEYLQSSSFMFRFICKYRSLVAQIQYVSFKQWFYVRYWKLSRWVPFIKTLLGFIITIPIPVIRFGDSKRKTDVKIYGRVRKGKSGTKIHALHSHSASLAFSITSANLSVW